MTLRDLAESCAAGGVPVGESTLSRIERGMSKPRPRLRATLAQLLDLDVDDFERSSRPDAGATGSAA